MGEGISPIFILLLGSFDPETKAVMEKIKEFVSKSFSEDVYAIFLDDIEIFVCDNQYTVLLEKSELTAYIFRGILLIDVVLLKGMRPDDYLKNLDEILKERYDSKIKEKLPLLEKLSGIAVLSEITILVRHKELTRGGEYIELAFLLERGLDPSKLFFLWNKNIPLSTMLKEFLDAYNFNLRFYESEDDLLDEVYRIVYYHLKRHKTASQYQ